jgi:Kef-type K+ transport system membrane component KefB
MDILDAVRDHALALPVMAKFALGMTVIVGVAPLCRAAGLPGVVGLLLCGILLGPHGLDVFGEHPAVADFFSDLGKLLLMFYAGLEIDLAVLQRSRGRSVLFGVATTTLPLLLGTAVGLVFGYGVLTAVVIGSLLASHTLLGLPVVKELGVGDREAVTVTVGATVISDTLSLVVFAVCVATFLSGFSPAGLVLQLVEIGAFCAAVLLGLRYLGASLLRRVEDKEEAYFILLLALLAASSVLAELIGLPGIIGAFLAGLALNPVVGEREAAAKLGFLGRSLFIPAFFVVTGFLIDPAGFVLGIADQLPLVAGILLALLLGKAAAAETCGRAFGYSAAERRTMWSLTLPQVAATLAAALVGRATLDASGEPLVDGRILDAVLVLVLVTSVLGTVLTARFGRRMAADAPERVERGPAAQDPGHAGPPHQDRGTLPTCPGATPS